MITYIYPFSYMLVRDWNSTNFYILPLPDYNLAETKAGSNSAFAETRAITKDNTVHGTEMTVEQFLAYRNV